jgi:hypothetical protein
MAKKIKKQKKKEAAATSSSLDDEEIDLDDSVHVPSIKKPDVIKYEAGAFEDPKLLNGSFQGSSLRGDPRKKQKKNKDLLLSGKAARITAPAKERVKTEDEPSAPHPYNVMSLEEGSIQFKKDELDRVRRWASQFLIRIYPKGLRVQSDNYNPLFYWMLGCQLVALNYQTPGFPMWLNEGKFMRAKNSGYILKPNRIHKPTGTSKTEVTYLTIEVISGWRIPRPWGIDTLYATEKVSKPKVEVSLWDPYTVAYNQYGNFNPEAIDLPKEHHLHREVFDINESKRLKEKKEKKNTQTEYEESKADDTIRMPFIQYALYKAKEGNPHNDTYEWETSGHLKSRDDRDPDPNPQQYFVSTDPELDMVVFKVTDDATYNFFTSPVNKIIGYYAISVCDMREGFRVVPLKGENGVPLPHGELLVYIRKEHKIDDE